MKLREALQKKKFVVTSEVQSPIDQEPEDRDDQRLIKGDLHGVDEPLDALDCHADGEDPEENGAAVSGQRIDLAGAKAETRIGGLFNSSVFSFSR